MLPVHNHSEFSALDGYSKVEEIADRIETLGLPGAFLTDHGTVAGLSSFRKAMEAKNLWVGYGMEAYQASGSNKVKKNAEGAAFGRGEDSYHLLVLAKSEEGYRNLLRLSDDAHRNGFYYDPRVDLESLRKFKDGLIVTSACLGGLVSQNIMNDAGVKPVSDLHKIFGDDFYLEISTYDTDEQRAVNAELVRIAEQRGIKLLYANDAHYAEPDQWDIHEALMCAQYNEYLLSPKKRGNVPDDKTLRHPQCLYIMGEDEVRERLDHLPQWAVDEAIQHSDDLMEECSFDISKPGLYLPKFKVPKEYADSADMLEALVVEGLEEKYELTDEVLDRAEFEFKSIVEAGLQDYFLIVWDYVNYAMRQGIMVGPGRGSVGGSILAHALGITTIDPIKYGLQFERFWNPGRADGLPDIDIDFERSSRQFMIEYAKKKYANVLPIGNHMRMRPKMAIDKAGAVLYPHAKVPYGAMVTIKKIIETTDDAGQSKPWDEMWEQLGEWASKEGKPHPLAEWEQKFPDMFELARALEGRISGYGVHASAVVISEVELNDHLPARMASDDDGRKVLVTQAEMKQVEKEGFPKFDFLGLRNLDTIMMTAILSGDYGDPEVLGPKLMSMIEERSKGSLKAMDDDLREALLKAMNHFRNEVNYNHLPDSYWELIDHGYTLGLFQIEDAPQPRRIGKKIRPRNVEELAFVVSLNRPGPLRDKDADGRSTVDRFLARRDGEEEAKFLHPILEENLATTYGDFVYQEQVIAYFRSVGYSLSDADHIRKILGKKLVSEMQKEKPVYLEAAGKYMPPQTAELIWAGIESFSKYSFNKSHAVGYAIILAWTMYAKWKWPVEFCMAAINTASKKERVARFVMEAQRLGVSVVPPDIDFAQPTVSKRGDQIMYGLQNVKGIGEEVAQKIVTGRPFESPEQFLAWTNSDAGKKMVNGKATKIVKANHFSALLNAGAFDGFGYRLAKCDKCDGVGRRRIDPTKRILDDCPDCKKLGFKRIEIPSIHKVAQLEEELLGISLSDPHAELIRKFRKELDALDPIYMAEQEEEEEVKVAGLVTKVDEKPVTWNQKPGSPTTWAHVTIRWQGEEVRFAAFANQFKTYGHMLKPDVLGRFTLKTGPKGPQLVRSKRYD